MSHNEEHHHESPKRVYFGIPFAFAFTFWFIIFLCLKTCDGPKNSCCKDGAECTKECKAKCEAEGKTDCANKEGAEGAVKEEDKKETTTATEEKKEGAAATEEKAEKPSEEKPAAEEKH
jgi:hypothetical protein